MNEPEAHEVEALAAVLLASWKAQGSLEPAFTTDPDDARIDARAILASDWLTQRDAALVARAKAEALREAAQDARNLDVPSPDSSRDERDAWSDWLRERAEGAAS